METAFDWKQTFEQLSPQLVLYARQLVDSRADAEDVVQQAFVRWWRRFPDGDSSHIPLLYAAVRTIALDQRRSDQRRVNREAKSEIAVAGEHAPAFDPLPEQKEAADIVEKALQTLPEEQREVVTLKLWGDLTFNEIAAMTKESINTVSGRYRYALQALHKKLSHLRADLLGAVPSHAPNILPFSQPTAEAMP
ncbi:RNA polymerase sigma factor [Prosthecobacter vanneervenii]|uniref:RNA polymerase sigma-70 factor (ECF subfamily) n=1 Tax=Prosthecobacter vanneervenii TaxID=48466 RepID=A0A7W7Y740_9BACT|nr:RNA polymerase sigma factor [Prosthecobacter vanneervenii]MBB5030841.1 RNA polymerase sigma-70 factor (ECF subfamily) [Prosthecobacter vanneervenii]